MAMVLSDAWRLGATATAAVCVAMSSALAAQEQVSVRAGQGVYAVAAQYRDRAGDLNLRQWSLAILALNPEAFPGGLASLKAGSRLRIPTSDQVRDLWPLGKALEDGADSSQIAEKVARLVPADTVVTVASGAVVGSTSEPVVATRSVAGPELVTPQPYFSWFVEPATEPAPQASEPESSGRQEEPAQAASGADEPAPQVVAAPAAAADNAAELGASGNLALDEGALSSPAAFSETELHSRARAASGSDSANSVLQEMREVEELYAGDIDFDYLYGVLLIDAAHPTEAIYPLLRAFQQVPGDLGIKLDLGRAYFESGENETARKIFTELAAENPPPQAALVIDSYLKAIEGRAGRYERQLVSQLSLFSGFDSNANNASSLTEFAGFFLDDVARSTESPYTLLQGQTRLTQPLGPRLNLQFGGDVQDRRYQDASEFSHTRWSVDSGLNFRRGDVSVFSNLTAGQNYVDGEDNHDFGALTAGLQWRTSVDRRVQASAKYGVLRYTEELSVRDVNQALASVGMSQRFNWAYGSDIGFDLAVGQDDAEEDASPFGRDLLGLSVRGVVQFRPSVQFSFASHYLEADYDGPFLGLARKDEQWFTDLTLHLTHNRWKNWAAEVLARYVENSSSVALYDYDRYEIGLGLKWLLD